jgi:hypothetical protein
MKITFKKEHLETVGKGAVKVGKAIVWEGTKAVAKNSGMAVISQAFSKKGEIKDLTLDDYLAGGKKKASKKGLSLLFKKKKDGAEEVLEAAVETGTKDTDANAEVEVETEKTK